MRKWIIFIMLIVMTPSLLFSRVLNNVTGIMGFGSDERLALFSDFSTIAGRDYFSLNNTSYELFGTGLKYNSIVFSGYAKRNMNYAFMFCNKGYKEEGEEEEEKLSINENYFSGILAYNLKRFGIKFGIRPYLFMNKILLDGQDYGRGTYFNFDIASNYQYRNISFSLLIRNVIKNSIKYDDGTMGKNRFFSISAAMAYSFKALTGAFILDESLHFMSRYKWKFMNFYLGLRREKSANVYGFNAGLRWIFKDYSLDYAFDYNSAGVTHFWGVSYRFWSRSKDLVLEKQPRYILRAAEMNVYPVRGLGSFYLATKGDSVIVANVAYKIKGLMGWQSKNYIIRPAVKSNIVLKPKISDDILSLKKAKAGKLKIKVRYSTDREYIYKDNLVVDIVPINSGNEAMFDELGAYITFKDQRIQGLVSRLIKEHNAIRNRIFVENKLQNAMLFYYLIQEFKILPLDYAKIQLPIETLQKQAGDVRDIAILYATILEAAGLRTYLLRWGDEFFIMFNTGVPAEEFGSFGLLQDRLVILDNYCYFIVNIEDCVAQQMRFIDNVINSYDTISSASGILSLDIENAFNYFPPVNSNVISANIKDYKYKVLKEKLLSEAGLLERAALNYYVKMYQDLIKSEPSNPDLYNQLGLLYAKNLQFDTAIHYFEKALSLDKEYYPAYNNLGNVYTELRQFELAERNFMVGIKLHPTDARAYVNLGIMFEKKGDNASAQIYYNKAAEISPERYGFLKNKIKK